MELGRNMNLSQFCRRRLRSVFKAIFILYLLVILSTTCKIGRYYYCSQGIEAEMEGPKEML